MIKVALVIIAVIALLVWTGDGAPPPPRVS